jgi:DNA-binding CsgD family transcriptional regulator
MPTPSPEKLIALIYESVAEPCAWQPTFEQCMRAIGGHSGFMFAKDHVLHSTGNIASSEIRVANHLERYLSYFAARNPWDHIFRHRPEADVGCVGDFAFSDSYRRSEWFNEWAKPQGYGDNIGCHVVRQKEFSCFLSIRRNESKGVFSTRDVALAKAVLPHFGPALKCWAHVERERHIRQSFAEALNGISTAVFIVGEDGRLLHVNCAAELHLSHGNGLISSRGYLRTRAHQSAVPLRDAIRAATKPSSLSHTPLSNVLIPQEDGGRPVIARVLPISSRDSWGSFAPRAGVAALFVTDPGVRRERPIDLFASIHSLTATEARVLAIIIEGDGLTKAAEMLGVAATTARTHLQEIFRKTGASKQAELVRLFFDTTDS